VAPAAAQRGGDRPNVVLVMTDDQEGESMRVMDGVRREIGRRGVTFENAYATFPLCCPSRASVLTGQYAHNHGVTSNGGPNGGFAAYDDSGSLPIALKRDGYRTGFVGKYLNGSTRTPRPTVPRGWSEWYSPWGNRGVKMFNYDLNENGRVRSYGSNPRDYQTDVFAAKARDFVRRRAGGRRPFFLALWTGAPHSEGRGDPNPRPAPRHKDRFSNRGLRMTPSFNEADVSDKPRFVQARPRLDGERRTAARNANQDRLASLLSVDDAVETVVDRLRRSGELDDTLIIYMSDNGYLLGEHRLRGKSKLYEESSAVPLLMRGPGVPSGAVRKQMAGNIDIAPTILDVAGVRPGRTPDGRSLVPLARKGNRARGRDILLENNSATAVHTRQYMYAEHESGETELYDLRADPYQLESIHVGGPPFRDLGPTRQAGVTALQRRLADRLGELRNCAGAACR
jgi:N-acetylglucosamine-6-sulfatase